jgi:hypothetical protein
LWRKLVYGRLADKLIQNHNGLFLKQI